MFVEEKALAVNSDFRGETHLPPDVADLPLDTTGLKTIADFRLAMIRFQAFSDEMLDSIGLGPRRYQALLAIRSQPASQGITVGEMARYLGIRANTATGMAQRMEDAGLIQRVRIASDRRIVRLQLTGLGEEKLKAAVNADLERLAQYHSLFRSMSEEVIPATDTQTPS